MSAEELKTYRPDLVLTFSRPNELKQLSALNIPAVYGVTSQSLDDVKRSAAGLRGSGRRQCAGESGKIRGVFR